MISLDIVVSTPRLVTLPKLHLRIYPVLGSNPVNTQQKSQQTNGHGTEGHTGRLRRRKACHLPPVLQQPAISRACVCVCVCRYEACCPNLKRPTESLGAAQAWLLYSRHAGSHMLRTCACVRACVCVRVLLGECADCTVYSWSVCTLCGKAVRQGSF